MMRIAAIALALCALSACQTSPTVVITGGDSFDVRYDAEASNEGEVDARAQRYCGGPVTFVSSEVRFDGLTYRTYRCGGS